MSRFARDVLVAVGCVYSQYVYGQAAMQKVLSLNVSPANGANDFVAECRKGATKGLTDRGYQVAGAGNKTAPTIQLIIADVSVEKHQVVGLNTIYLSASVPVAAANLEMASGKRGDTLLITGNDQSSMEDICEASAKGLIDGPEAVKKQQAQAQAQEDAKSAALVGAFAGLLGAISPSGSTNAPNVPAFPPQQSPPWLEPSHSELRNLLKPTDVTAADGVFINLRQAFRSGDRTLLRPQIDAVRNLENHYPNSFCSQRDTSQNCLAANALSHLESRIETVYSIGYAK